MLFNLGIEKIAVLLVVALIVIGPERLPKLAADAGRLLRQLRKLAQSATAEIKDELGPELADHLAALDLADLHPRRLIERHLLADDPDGAPRAVALATPLAPGERPPFDPDAT